MKALNISLEYGVAGICVLLTIMILARVGEFLWNLRKEKDNLSEKGVGQLTIAMQENTLEMRQLKTKIEQLETGVSELPKFKTDIRRFYAAIKEVAGDRWPKIRDEILKDEFHI